MTEIVLGIRLKADGSGLVGAVQLSRQELDKLRNGFGEADRSAERLNRTTDRTSNSQGRLARTVLSVAGAWLSVRGAMSLVNDFRQEEQATAKLDASITSMGRSTANLSHQLLALSAQVQSEGILGDEAIIEGQSFLTTYRDITDDMLPRATRVMADLAAKMGGDVVNAANLVGKASMGMTGELARVGITLSDAAKESKDFELILTEIESQVAGTNKALGDTATGGLQRLGNALGDLREIAGRSIAEGLTRHLTDFLAIVQDPKTADSIRMLADSAAEAFSFLSRKLAESLTLTQRLGTEIARAVAGGGAGGDFFDLDQAGLIKKGAEIEHSISALLTNPANRDVGGNLFGAAQQELARLEDQLGQVNLLFGMTRDDARQASNASQEAGGAANRVAEEALKQFEKMAEQLEKQVALHGHTGAAAEARWEIERAGLRESDPALAERIVRLADERDAQVASSEALAARLKLEVKLQEQQERANEGFAKVTRALALETEIMVAQIAGRTDLIAALEFEQEARAVVAQLSSAMGRDILPEEAEKLGELVRAHRAATDELERHKDAQDAAKKKAEEATRALEREAEAARELALQPFKNALDGMQSAFTDFFASVFRGGIDSFKDLAGAIKDIFIRLAAEIAALLVFRPVVAGILSSLGGSALAAQLGLSAGPGGFSLPGFPGMGNLFSGAGDWINSLGAGFGIGTVPGVAGGIAGMPGTAGITQFFASPAAGNLIGGGITSASLTSILGAGALGFMGGGMFADLLGLNSQNGSIGGGIGAAIGMATPLGPLGALIGGGLGSVIGGLFGNDKDYPFAQAQIIVNPEGVARIGNVQSLDGGDTSMAQQLAQAVVDQFNALVESQGITFDKGFGFSIGHSVGRGALSEGFFAGQSGNLFEEGTTHMGIQSADQALQAALQYALGKGTPGDPPALVAARDQFNEQMERQLAILDATDPVLEQITQRFGDMREQAEALGADTGLIDRLETRAIEEHAAALEQSRGAFEAAIEAQLAADPVLAQLTLRFAEMRQQAEALGASVEMINQLEAQAIAQLNAQRNLAHADFKRSITDQIDLFRSATPQLTQLQQQYRDLLAQVPQYATGQGLGLTRLIQTLYGEQLAVLANEFSGQLRGLAEQARGILQIDQLTNFGQQLQVGNLAAGTPLDRLDAARGFYDDIAAQALAGDAAALQQFPAVAQQMLALGRDVFASGPEYAALFTDVNSTLNQVLGQSQQQFDSLFSGLDFTMRETTADQIAELRKLKADIVAGLNAVRAEIARLPAAARAA